MGSASFRNAFVLHKWYDTPLSDLPRLFVYFTPAMILNLLVCLSVIFSMLPQPFKTHQSVCVPTFFMTLSDLSVCLPSPCLAIIIISSISIVHFNILYKSYFFQISLYWLDLFELNLFKSLTKLTHPMMCSCNTWFRSTENKLLPFYW